MNIILLIFIILAATFIAAGANNMVSVMTALDGFFEKAEVPDYWFATVQENEFARFESFAEEKQYDFRQQKLIQIDPADVTVNGEDFECSGSVVISSIGNSITVFDGDDKELTQIEDGEIYLTGRLFHDAAYDFKAGDTIEITANGKTKSFILKGSAKDALFGSSMVGMTRFLISENDCKYFDTEGTSVYYSVCVYTEDNGFKEQFDALELNMVMNIDRSTVKLMYIMDMVIAGVVLIVSVCLILISMVVLRFTIHFTIQEEFREIGVMKAIGIENRRIRGLYIMKYLAVSCVGGILGLLFSIPFGRLMLGNLSENIVISGEKNYFLNMICAGLVVAVVVLFCYFCTKGVKRLSPIDAIRSGENGERYWGKGLIHLSRSGVAPVPFLAVNDILSGIRRFATMIVIFTLGMLLVLIPVNAINTLQSDHLITWFNMAECDHVINKEILFNESVKNREMLEAYVDGIRKTLLEEGMEAEVFQEVMFRMNITFRGKKMSSLAFQGIGDVTADQYEYLEGSAPQNNNEVAISHIVAENTGARIGDTVEIKNGEETKRYMVTAIYQSMNNMGEGIRFSEGEQLDYNYAAGSFAVQIRYTDTQEKEELSRRKELLAELFPDDKIYTAGEYVNDMIGDVSGQLQGIKQLILMIVLFINILVTVLMERSFLIKEKGGIAMLKAIGFQNHSLIEWQTLRIGIILFLSVLAGTVLSKPLSKLSTEKIFRLMGAQSIEIAVRPLEIYVVYPLVVLCVTVLAAGLASLQIRNIRASETSNIE